MNLPEGLPSSGIPNLAARRFSPGVPKITYVYDFGVNWVHEITRQKMITLEPG